MSRDTRDWAGTRTVRQIGGTARGRRATDLRHAKNLYDKFVGYNLDMLV
jgi:hypothetical protein